MWNYLFFSPTRFAQSPCLPILLCPRILPERRTQMLVGQYFSAALEPSRIVPARTVISYLFLYTFRAVPCAVLSEGSALHGVCADRTRFARVRADFHRLMGATGALSASVFGAPVTGGQAAGGTRFSPEPLSQSRRSQERPRALTTHFQATKRIFRPRVCVSGVRPEIKLFSRSARRSNQARFEHLTSRDRTKNFELWFDPECSG